MAREHYEEAKRLLLKLHELDAQGKDQSPEADEVRAQMEGQEQFLTESEQVRLNGLSGDLYMLTGTEVPESTTVPVSKEEFLKAIETKQWDLVLRAIRQRIAPHIAVQSALIRSMCWSGLGDFDVALLFAKFAEAMAPNNPACHMLVLDSLLHLEYFDSAETYMVKHPSIGNFVQSLKNGTADEHIKCYNSEVIGEYKNSAFATAA